MSSLTIRVSTPAPDPLALGSDYSFSFTVDGTQPPPLPSSFHGEIHFSDNPPTTSSTVDILAPGVSGSAAVAAILSVDPNLVYQVNVRGDIPDTLAKEGGVENDLLTFLVDGRVAARAGWHAGTSVLLNLHPPTANTGGPYAALVNTAKSLVGSATDWLETDTAAYAWNLNGNGACDDLTAPNPACTFSSIGTKIVDLKVTDGQGGEGSATTSVVVIELEGLTGQAYDGTPKSVAVLGVELPLTYTVTYDGFLTPPTDVGTHAVVVTISNGASVSATMVIGAPPPPLPSSFHGEIHFIDNPPFSTDTVQIFAPGVSGTTATAAIRTIDSYLGFELNVRGDIDGTPTKEGGMENDPLTFMINGRIAAMAYWHTGTSVLLNLHPPAANAGGPYAALINTAKSLAGSAADWLVTDSAAYAWNLNGSGACDNLNIQSPSCTFSSTGTKIIDLKVTDGQGGEGTAVASLIVLELGGLTGNTYDGGTHPITVTGDTGYTVTYAGSSTPPTNAGTYVVVVTASNGAAITTSMTIDPKTASLAAVAAGKVYGTADPALNTAPVGFLSADLGPGRITFSASRLAGESVALSPYTITPAANDNGSGLLANYTVTYTPADFTITPASATVTLSDLTAIYDGTPKSVTVTTGPAGLSYNVSYDGSSDPPSNTGSYAVVVTITDPNYTGSASGTFVIVGKCSLDLVPGWNLVSCNVHPASTDPADVLSDISGHYDLVYAWDATGDSPNSGNWQKYAPPPLPPFQNNLPILDEKMGFWINMTEPDTLDIVGSVPASTEIALWDNVGGWNLVGYPSIMDRALPGALSDHGVNDLFTLIIAYHPIDTADPWKLFDLLAYQYFPYSNDLQTMTPGWGYWINVTADSTWSVNFLADPVGP